MKGIFFPQRKITYPLSSLILGYYYEITDSLKERATDSTPLEVPVYLSKKSLH